MSKLMLYILTLLLVMLVVFLFFRQIDSAIELDDLRSQVLLQRKEFQFLQTVANESLTSACALPVERLEAIVESARNSIVSWQGNTALVGPYRVYEQGGCILKIELVAF